MREIFYVYLQNSVQLSLIIMLMLFVSPILAHRYSSKCRYYLWAIVFAALLLPIRANIKLTLPEFLQATVPQGATQAVSHVAAANTPASLDWLQYAGILWITGLSVFLIWHLFSHLRFLSAVKRWSEDVRDVDILKIFNNTKAELHISKCIPVKSCACIKTPMVVGLLRPVVLLPQVTFAQDELPLILKHELVHIKRKDLWYKILMLLTLAIHWFNPVIHLAVRSVLNLCEISCDEEVLKGIGSKGRARYGESVIGTVRNSGAYKTALSTNFYSGTKGMKKRIYAMMDMSKKRFSPVLFMAVVMVTMCGTTAFALSPATSPASDNSGEQQLGQTMTADTEPSYVYSTEPNYGYNVTPTDTSQGDSESRSSNENSLPPNALIRTDEDTPVESSQEPSYDPEVSRLIPGEES